MKTIETIYGTFLRESAPRLRLAYDYEDATIKAFVRVLEDFCPKFFLDIGANIGVYSIAASRIAEIEFIYSFEPSPMTVRLLRQNIAVQDCPSRYSVFDLALSDHGGSVGFRDLGNMAGNNCISDSPSIASGSDDSVIISVQTAAIDELFQEERCNFAMKIDVEGHEANVLKGAEKFLTHNCGVLQIEIFDGSQTKIIAEMDRLGYALVIRCKQDYFFTNVNDNSKVERWRAIYCEEIAHALHMLMRHNRQRRVVLKCVKNALGIAASEDIASTKLQCMVSTLKEIYSRIKFRPDPLTDAREPLKIVG